MIMTASAIQFAVGGPGEWLDETQFAVRVYVADVLGVPPQSPTLVDAADRLRERATARLGMTLQVPTSSAASPPVPEFATDDVCDGAADSAHLYARAG